MFSLCCKATCVLIKMHMCSCMLYILQNFCQITFARSSSHFRLFYVSGNMSMTERTVKSVLLWIIDLLTLHL